MDFSCNKCGSINVFIDDRGYQKALVCRECNSWIKWISKKDLPLAIKFIRDNKFEELLEKNIIIEYENIGIAEQRNLIEITRDISRCLTNHEYSMIMLVYKQALNRMEELAKKQDINI